VPFLAATGTVSRDEEPTRGLRGILDQKALALKPVSCLHQRAVHLRLLLIDLLLVSGYYDVALGDFDYLWGRWRWDMRACPACHRGRMIAVKPLAAVRVSPGIQDTS
jgi:hypothetical protein